MRIMRYQRYEAFGVVDDCVRIGSAVSRHGKQRLILSSMRGNSEIDVEKDFWSIINVRKNIYLREFWSAKL